FGVSMYEMFSFDLPWQRGQDGLAAMSHGQSKPPPLSKHCPWVEPTLAAAIHKCMEAEPEKRFSSMKSFLNAIRSVKSERVS
ncbi:MAG: hypothetical protein KDA44_15930, partial [Planctomycetales bacterium]|nr:hypothetical protein [Planctomycetales bacterium]